MEFRTYRNDVKGAYVSFLRYMLRQLLQKALLFQRFRGLKKNAQYETCGDLWLCLVLFVGGCVAVK